MYRPKGSTRAGNDILYLDLVTTQDAKKKKHDRSCLQGGELATGDFVVATEGEVCLHVILLDLILCNGVSLFCSCQELRLERT